MHADKIGRIRYKKCLHNEIDWPSDDPIPLQLLKGINVRMSVEIIVELIRHLFTCAVLSMSKGRVVVLRNEPKNRNKNTPMSCTVQYFLGY